MQHFAAEHRLITVYELADALELPAKWLNTEAQAGRIPHLRIGRRLLFNVEAVKAVLLNRAGHHRTNSPTPIRTENSAAADSAGIARAVAHRGRGDP